VAHIIHTELTLSARDSLAVYIPESFREHGREQIADVRHQDKEYDDKYRQDTDSGWG